MGSEGREPNSPSGALPSGASLSRPPSKLHTPDSALEFPVVDCCGMIALSLRGPMRASLSVLDSGGSGAMPVRRLLAFVGVGLIVIGTLAAAVAVTGPSPRVAVSRIGMGTSSRINNRVPGKVELDSS